MRGCSFFIIILLLTSLSYADANEGKSRANTIGKQMQDSYSDPKDAKNKLMNPVISSTKMSTMSASYKCPDTEKVFSSSSECASECSSTCVKNEFDAMIQCSSEEEALSIMPAGFGTGGEVQLQVAFDTDLDGTKDQTFTTSNISGFCTNGYVSCTPGTWNNCKYFELGVKHKCENSGATYDTYRECSTSCGGVCTPADNKVTATQRPVTEMRHAGGCYCANASCGSSFNATFQQSLGYFGGGISAHLMNELGIVISDTKIDVTTLSVKYLGASATSCAGAEENVEGLKRSYQLGEKPDASEELLNQMADPDSKYNTVMEPWTNNISNHECAIRNTPMVNTGEIDEFWCTPGSITTRTVNRSGSYSDRQFTQHYQCVDEDGDGRGETMRYKLDCANQGEGYSRCDNSTSTGWQSVSLNSYPGGDRSSGARVSVRWGSDGGVDTAQLLYNVTCSESLCQLKHWAYVGRYGSGNNALTTTTLSSMREEILTVSRNDTCTAYAEDPDCRLYEEEINGTDTVSNYIATGMMFQSKCTEVSGNSGKYIVCDYGDRFDVTGASKSFITADGVQRYADPSVYTISSKADGMEYFEIKRTYTCETDTEFDFSGAKAQGDMIGSTINRDTGDFNYLVDGQTNSGNVKIDTDGYDSCTYSCVVQTGNQDTEVFPDQETRRTTTDIVTEERPCGVDRNTAERTCPYDQLTESIIKDCTCTNAFNQVIAGFGIVSDAVKDMICSGD
ncbi:conjugal transfer protein TraN [Geovibrio sp. ADMFC3]